MASRKADAMLVRYSPLLLLLLLGEASSAHSRLAVRLSSHTEQPQSSVVRVGAALRVVRRLRGGAAAEDDVVPATDAPSRLRLTVAAEDAGDLSSLFLSPALLKALGLSGGEPVLLRGRKQRKTVCVALAAADVTLGADEVRLSAGARANLRLAPGEDVVLSPVRELAEAQRVELCVIRESAVGFEGIVYIVIYSIVV